MTSRTIMSNDINNVIANNTKVSKKSESLGSKNDSFSKVMEKNNYENQDVSVLKHDKSDFHSSRPEVISKKNITYLENNDNSQPKVIFTKEQFATDVETTINDIASAYKETLDLSDEELMEIMENLAINVFQLPMQDLAKNIVLEANGEKDITALLVNENALEDLQSMNQFFDKYNAEIRLNIPVEELEGLVKEAISNLVASKEDALANNYMTDNQQILDTTKDINLDVNTNIDLENVYSLDKSEKVTLSETVVLDDGREINIEVVDVRDNMTRFAKLDSISKDLENQNINSKSIYVQEKLTGELEETLVKNDNNNQLQSLLQNTTENTQEVLEQNSTTQDVKGQIIETNEKQSKEVLKENTSVKDLADIDNVNNRANQDTKSLEMFNKNNQIEENELMDLNDISFEDGVEVNDALTKNDTSIDTDNESLNEKLFDNTVNTDMDTESDSFNNNSDNDFRNDTSNETFYDKFIANLEKSFGIDEGSLVNEVSHLKEMQEIVNQVVDKIKVHISKEMTTMKLNLNPEHLGKVELEVTSKSGVLTADFVVENETAKEALEKGLPALIEKFHEQGLKVEAIEVRIADYNFTNQENERNRAGNQGNEDKKKKRNGKIALDEVSSQQEVVQEEHKIMSNHGIDYTA